MSQLAAGGEGVRRSADSLRPETQRWRLQRPSVNLTGVDRIGRMLIGVAGGAIGIALLMSSGPILAVVLEVLLVLAGVDLLVTGALGHCPLYQKLGYVPPSRRDPR